MSRKGDPRYQPLVLPCLKHLDYLVINELEAGEFSGTEMRTADDGPHIDNISLAAAKLLAAGGETTGGDPLPGRRVGRSRRAGRRVDPSRMLSQAEIIGSVGAGDAFCAGFLYGCHEAWSLQASVRLAHACARASLLCANAIDGAKTLEALQQEMDLPA